jgi:phosphatidylglycerophosphate synthase
VKIQFEKKSCFYIKRMVNKLSDDIDCPFDVQLYKFIDTHLHVYYDLGFTPNMVTTFSILFGLLAAQQIMRKKCKIAAIMLVISYYLDCVDGKLARQYNMITKFGDIYDHAGDLIKIIVIFIALFASTKKMTETKWIYISIFIVLTLIQCMHLGYQEAIYDKTDESVILHMWRKMVAFDSNPEQTIHYTKYFGCGTWYLCFAVLIIFWCK